MTLESRVGELGHEIFERAAAAYPYPGTRPWLLDRMVAWTDADPRLKAASFQLMECLPALATDASIVRHLREYFRFHNVCLPRMAGWLLDRADHPLLERLVGLSTRFAAGAMAGRFVTGHDVESVARTLLRLRQKGMAVTLDLLGESTLSRAQADRYASMNADLIARLSPQALNWPDRPLLDQSAYGPQPRVNVSIKLTGLVPHLNPAAPDASFEAVSDRLRPLLLAARRLGAFINVDMEHHAVRDLTLEIFMRLLMEPEFRDWRDVGIVVQAYLRDAERDLSRLLAWREKRGAPFAIRLVKGAYWDSETAAAARAGQAPPVWTRKWQSDACYEHLAGTLLQHATRIRPCFASHNVRTLAFVMAKAEALGVPISAYEIQMLYGMGDPLKSAIAGMGRCLRVYAPHGDMLPGVAYLIRRLMENTANDSFLKQGFRDRPSYARMLRAPGSGEPPTSARADAPTRSNESTKDVALMNEDHHADRQTALDLDHAMNPYQPCPGLDLAQSATRDDLIREIERLRDEAPHDLALAPFNTPPRGDGLMISADPSSPGRSPARIRPAREAEVDATTAMQRKAFASRDGDGMGGGGLASRSRAETLDHLADVLREQRIPLAAALIAEAGMRPVEADHEVRQAIDYVAYHARGACILHEAGRRRDLPGEANGVSLRPHGLAAVVGSDHSPLAAPAGLITAAYAMGNHVIWSPPTRFALCTGLLAQAVQKAGAAPSEITLLPCDDEAVTEYLTGHVEVDLLLAAGSAAFVRSLFANSVNARKDDRSRSVILEIGGEGGLLVDEDADLDLAVKSVLTSALVWAGQGRARARKAFVHRAVFAAFSERLREAAGSLVAGKADRLDIDVGPLMDATAAEAFASFQSESTLVTPGGHDGEAGPSGGGIFAPRVFSLKDPRAMAQLEAPSGPALFVAPVHSFNEGLGALAELPWALVLGVFSRSPENLRLAQRRLKGATLFLNRATAWPEVERHPLICRGGSAGAAIGGAGHGQGDVGLGLGSLALLTRMAIPLITSESTARHGYDPTTSPTGVVSPAQTLERQDLFGPGSPEELRCNR